MRHALSSISIIPQPRSSPNVTINRIRCCHYRCILTPTELEHRSETSTVFGKVDILNRKVLAPQPLGFPKAYFQCNFSLNIRVTRNVATRYAVRIDQAPALQAEIFPISVSTKCNNSSCPRRLIQYFSFNLRQDGYL